MLALSKTYDVRDFEQAEYVDLLQIVDEHLGTGQHALRRWEYFTALRAQWAWNAYASLPGARPRGPIYDVGGAGSPFYKMVGIDSVRVIDPKEGWMLESFVRDATARLAGEVYCLSVLEHILDINTFCYYLACLVAPGGLLFLTVDYQPEDGPDEKMFHWMRQRMFTPHTVQGLIDLFVTQYQFTILGTSDPIYHGHFENWGYSAASLALVKRF